MTPLLVATLTAFGVAVVAAAGISYTSYHRGQPAMMYQNIATILAVFTLPGVILALFPSVLAGADFTRLFLTGMSLTAGVLAALCLLVYGIKASAAPAPPAPAAAFQALPSSAPAVSPPAVPPPASAPAPPPPPPPVVPPVPAATAPGLTAAGPAGAADPYATRPLTAPPPSPTSVLPPGSAPEIGAAPPVVAAATRSFEAVSSPTLVLGPDAPVHMAWLVYLGGPRAGDAIRLAPDSVIGREPPAQGGGIVLADSAVSGIHARVVQDADLGRFVIHDLGSTNGTLVNGQKVSRQPLADKDRLRLGRTDLAFIEVRYDPAAAAGAV